ncbi:MAG: phage holin family protein [Candidatus Nealsonbacteria bacterium]
MERLFWHIVAGSLAIFLATKFVPGVGVEIIPGKSIFFGIEFTQEWQILLFIGSVLGLINLLIKPVLDKITLPLKVLTLGLFSLILNMIVVWSLDILFPELQISGITPLFFTTIIIWIINFFLGLRR